MAETAGFKRWLKKLSPAARESGFQELSRQATALVTDIRSRAPVKTGKLAQSVRREDHAGAGQIRIMAGGPLTTVPVRNGQLPSYDYSRAVEFGTSDTPAQPFFFPTLRSRRAVVKKAVNDAMKKKLEAE